MSLQILFSDYNLLSDKNSLFCNGLYIIKKASYQEKKGPLKFNSVTQAVSCCFVQALDNYESYGDPLYGGNNETHKTNGNRLCSITFLLNLLAQSIFSFTSGQSYLTSTGDSRGGLRETICPLKKHKIKTEILNGCVT